MNWNRLNRGPLMEEAGEPGGGGEPAPVETPKDTPSAKPEGYHNWIRPDGSFVENHADNAPDDLADLREVFGRHKNVRSLGQALRDSRQKISDMGGDRMVKMLGENPTADEVKAYRAKMGAPEDEKGYGLDVAPEGVDAKDWNAEFGGAIAKVLSKHHVSKAVAAELAAVQRDFAAREFAAAEAAEKAETEARENEWRQKWGKDYDANMDKIRQVQESFKGRSMREILLGLHEHLQEDGSAVRKTFGVSQLDVNGGNPRTRAQDMVMNPANPDHDNYHGKNGRAAQAAAKAKYRSLMEQHYANKG